MNNQINNEIKSNTHEIIIKETRKINRTSGRRIINIIFNLLSSLFYFHISFFSNSLLIV